MVSRQTQTASKTTHSRHRANPVGLGRLLILALTVGLISLGHGGVWWAGLLLLGLILLAVSRLGAWWAPWSCSAGLASLVFWHRQILHPWAAILILCGSALGFALALLQQQS